MGYINLSTVHLTLGNRQAACDAAIAARQADADLFYSLIADTWFIAINTNWGDAVRAQETVDYWRPVVKALELRMFSDFLDFFEALLAIKAGHLSRGMKELDDARARFERAGSGWGLFNCDLAVGQIYSQIATGEASGDLSAVLHNPGFVLKHARGAAKRARTTLERLAATAESRGFLGLLPGIEFELAKLAAHDRRKDDAAAHANRVIELLALEPDATYVIDAKDLLSRL